MNAHTFFKHPRDVSFLYLCRGDTLDFRDQIASEASVLDEDAEAAEEVAAAVVSFGSGASDEKGVKRVDVRGFSNV